MIASHPYARDGPVIQTAIGAVLRWSPIAPVGQGSRTTPSRRGKIPTPGVMVAAWCSIIQALRPAAAFRWAGSPPPRILDMQQEPQRAAFNAYRVAFRANQASPNLRNAHALVRSYSALMAAMGLPMPEASE